MRWSNRLLREIETPAIDAFLTEVVEVCRRHGLSISHEDGHGSFEVEEMDEANIGWLMAASDNTGRGREGPPQVEFEHLP